MLFPDSTGQLLLMILCGTLFFVFRASHYTVATALMTLLVVISFNQQGIGFAVILPRLFDTMICVCCPYLQFVSCCLTGKHIVCETSCGMRFANRDYLAQIIGQYRLGKKDNFAYRSVRRHAHNQDAQLNAAINNMMAEPGRYQTAIDESFRFLCLNHSMLNYISTLGAHRMQLEDDGVYDMVSKAHRSIYQALDTLVMTLNGEKVADESPNFGTALLSIDGWRDDNEKSR